MTRDVFAQFLSALIRTLYNDTKMSVKSLAVNDGARQMLTNLMSFGPKLPEIVAGMRPADDPNILDLRTFLLVSPLNVRVVVKLAMLIFDEDTAWKLVDDVAQNYDDVPFSNNGHEPDDLSDEYYSDYDYHAERDDEDDEEDDEEEEEDDWDDDEDEAY